jgi:hypothetical protein
MKTVARIIVVTIGLGISAMADPATLQPTTATANDAAATPNATKQVNLNQPTQAAEQDQAAQDDQQDDSFFGKPGSTKRWCWYIGGGVAVAITATAIYLYFRDAQVQPPSAVAPAELRRDAASKPIGAETGQPNPIVPPSQPIQPQNTPVTTQAQPTTTTPTTQAPSTPASTPRAITHVKPITPAAPTPQPSDKPAANQLSNQSAANRMAAPLIIDNDDDWAAVAQDPEAERRSFAAVRAIDITLEGQAMIGQAFDASVDAADAKTLKELRSQTL